MDYREQQIFTQPRLVLYDRLRKIRKKRFHEEKKPSTKKNYTYFWQTFTKFYVDYEVENVSLTNDGLFKKYFEHMVYEQGYQNSYASTCLSVLVACLNALDMPHKYKRAKVFKGMARKHRESEEMFLTNEEIRLLLDYYPKKDRQQIVYDQFLISLFTGARRSEVPSVRRKDNHIEYISLKTSKGVRVAYTDKMEDALARGIYTHELRHEYVNMDIHEIFQKAGITSKVIVYDRRGKTSTGKAIEKWRACSFHTARKTHGKILLENGVDIYTVSNLLGHSSISVTEKAYASISKDEQIDRASKAMANIKF